MVDVAKRGGLFPSDVALYRHSMPNVEFLHERYSTFHLAANYAFPREQTVFSSCVFEGIRVPADAPWETTYTTERSKVISRPTVKLYYLPGSVGKF